jgi:hypothetical protein
MTRASTGYVPFEQWPKWAQEFDFEIMGRIGELTALDEADDDPVVQRAVEELQWCRDELRYYVSLGLSVGLNV